MEFTLLFLAIAIVMLAADRAMAASRNRNVSKSVIAIGNAS